MANILSVTNSEELMKALASAKGGDTIELAGGDYGNLSLINGKTVFDVTFDSEVTLRSADLDKPASFSGVDLRGVSNLTFDGLVFDYEFSTGDPISIRPFQIGYGSSDITIKNSVFDGDLASGISEIDDGYGYGIGLSVRNASNISVENNEFFNWHRGAVYSQIEGLSVLRNEVYAIRSDGFDFVEVKSVLIEGNYLHDFNGSPNSNDHRDMIQFWTSGTTSPTTNVVIRDNILDIGSGSYTQSIFMRNEEVDLGRAGSEMNYRNIVIENNTIYNGHTHGITVGETDGLTIRNNSVLHASGDTNDLSSSISIPKINVSSASTSVIIESNITGAVTGAKGQLDWAVAGNAIIQPTDYLEQFITSTTDAESGSHGFIIIPESMVEQLGAGSSAVQFTDAPATLTPQFQVYSDTSTAQSVIFDAALTVGPLGLVADSDAQFLWDFGDGNTATGQVVKHDFASPGYHDVTLTVTAKDGTTAQAQFTAGIAGEGIVQFDTQSGQFEVLSYGEETFLDIGAMPLVSNADGAALRLGAEGTQAKVAASELSRFFGTDAFEMSMTLKAATTTSWGEIARIHTSFTSSVDKNGNFSLDLFLDNGTRVNMISKGIALNDGAHHNVTVRFDGAIGSAEIRIDGQVVASQDVSGALGGGARSLDFGNPWGEQNFAGELSAFSLSAASRDFPIYEGQELPPSGEHTDTISPEITDTEEETVLDNGSVLDSGETVISEPTAPEETNTSPESDPVLQEPVEVPVLEEESGQPGLLLKGGYVLDFAAIATSGTIKLHDNAHVVDTPNGLALSFDGKRDFVELGRLTEFEASQKIAFSVDFTSDNATNRAERLAWNHEKIGLSLEGDGVRVHVGNTNNSFGEGFLVTGLGLKDGNQHSATVMVDAETDRLQIIVDDVLVLDKDDVDFDFVGAGGHEWGWSLGTSWNRWFEGEVHELQVSDDFSFVETPVTTDEALIA